MRSNGGGIKGKIMKTLIAICLLTGLAFSAFASGEAPSCGKQAGLTRLHNPGLQVYFAAHRSLEVELGV